MIPCLLYQGRVFGAPAERFPKHLYLTPPTQDAVATWLWDGRVYPDREYPRWSNVVHDYAPKAVPTIDYQLRIEPLETGKMTRPFILSLWVAPSFWSPSQRFELLNKAAVSHVIAFGGDEIGLRFVAGRLYELAFGERWPIPLTG